MALNPSSFAQAFLFTEDNIDDYFPPPPQSLRPNFISMDEMLIGGFDRNKKKHIKGYRFSTNIDIEDIPVYIESFEMIEFHDYKIVAEAYDYVGRLLKDSAAIYVKEGHGVYEDKGIDIDEWIAILKAVKEAKRKEKE